MTREAARIDRDEDVRRIAKALGVQGPDLQGQICAAAVDRVSRRMSDFEIEPLSLDDVQRVVLDMTRVHVVRVTTDDELAKLNVDLAKQPVLPVQLELEFRGNTEAVVFRRPDADPRTAYFTAVVDARGDRQRRAWFGERHEPAHLLVPDRAGQQAWRRTTVERPEPVEQVIDTIASRVGFWEPIVRPIVERALRDHGNVLDAFDAARVALAPMASREACYRAFARLLPEPLFVVRVDWGCRRSDPDNREGSFALRVQTTIRNDAAEHAGMIIPANFRIPDHSVILHACADRRGTLQEDDDLGRWADSTGKRLKARLVRVTARGAWAALLATSQA